MERLKIGLGEARNRLKFWSHIYDHIAHANFDFGHCKGYDNIDVFEFENEHFAFVEHEVGFVERHFKDIHVLGWPALRPDAVDQIASLGHQFYQIRKQKPLIDWLPKGFVVLIGAVELAGLLAQVLLLVLLLEHFSWDLGRDLWVLTCIKDRSN